LVSLTRFQRFIGSSLFVVVLGSGSLVCFFVVWYCFVVSRISAFVLGLLSALFLLLRRAFVFTYIFFSLAVCCLSRRSFAQVSLGSVRI
jgi:hypothetical protein